MDTRTDTLLTHVVKRVGCDLPQAARDLQSVLEVLGAHLVGDDRSDLARLLPDDCGGLLTVIEPASESPTPTAFVTAVDKRGNAPMAEAQRTFDATLPTLTDDALLRRAVTQLPPGHADLFGRTGPM